MDQVHEGSPRTWGPRFVVSPNKELFSKALQAKKDCHFKYIWTSQGKIFMRKEDSTNVIQIICEKDIESKIYWTEYTDK